MFFLIKEIFVFYSKDELVVFGKLNQSKEKLINLTENDMDLCKKLGFKTDRSKWAEYINEIE